MKVRPSVGKMCDNCQIIKRDGRVRVSCKSNPKHKQTQPIKKKKIAKF